MVKVYINYNPTDNYDYATSIISGYLPRIRDYVELVDWLSWIPKGDTWQIIIDGTTDKDGEPTKEHLLRAKVFAQRMYDLGAEVFVRDNRTDEWTTFKGSYFTNETLLKVECAKSLRWEVGLEYFKKDVAKFKQLLADETDDLKIVQLKNMFEKENKRMTDYIENEERRIKSLMLYWNSFS